MEAMATQAHPGPRPRSRILRCTLRLWLLVAASLLGVALPARAQQLAPRNLDVHAVTGCCVCRGVKNGDVNYLNSCVDGRTVDSCLQKCQSEQTRSFIFGYQQTCSEGCAGFSTAALPNQ